MSNLKLKLLLTFFAGITSALAFAPTYLFFVLFFTLPCFLFFLHKCNSYKESCLLGWSFGFGFFLYGLYWISYALLVDKDLFGWLVPFAITLIPAILALYFGLLGILVYKVRKHILPLTISFISAWILIEIIRTNLFTGFPWLTLGYSLSNYISLIQSASLFGVYGVSFVILLVTTSPFVLFTGYQKSKKSTIIFIVIATAIFGSNFVYGKWRLNNAEREFLPYSVKIVQPNISQELKWDRRYREANLKKIMDLSKTKDSENPTYIIWPEAAITYSLTDKSTRDKIKEIIPEEGYLITGGIRLSQNKILKLMSSLFVIDSDGNILDYYDKMHLVPFGEYVPFRNIIPSTLSKITHGFLDYTPGKKAKIIKPEKDLPSFRALICYESFFPQEILIEEDKPDFLLNITNDAWYRDSPGPYHHLDMTKFRAIEYNLPVVRSANTGISIITSQYGEILQQLPINKSGFLLIYLLKSNKKKTLYELYANTILIVFLVITFTSAYLYVHGNR